MEACNLGNAEIIRLLLGRNASTLQEDDDGWNAVDHLNDYIVRNQASLEAESIEELLQLKDSMEGKQRAGGSIVVLSERRPCNDCCRFSRSHSPSSAPASS